MVMKKIAAMSRMPMIEPTIHSALPKPLARRCNFPCK